MKVYAVFDTNVLVSALISRQADTAVVHAHQSYHTDGYCI